MRRPLFVAALFLVIIAALRLKAGGADFVPPDSVGTGELAAYEELYVTGQVYQKDEKSIYLKSVVLWNSSASGQSAADSRQKISCQENLICETQLAEAIPLGCTVSVSGTFYPFSQATNPGEFDSAVYYRTLKIGGKLRDTVILSRSAGFWRVREELFWLKRCLRERLYRAFPEKEAAVMSALLLGDKSDLDSELKDLYRRSGILHILSISSLHITIIGMSVYKMLRKLGMPICPAAVVGSVLLLLYGAMTGFSVSACRAIGMYLIRMLAEAVGRTYDMLTALGVMAALMVIDNPYYLRSSGFLLSFGSVLGLGVVYPALTPKLPDNTPCPASYFLQSVFASLSITLTTLPIQLWYYYEIPVYSVFLNLFVIPCMKPLMVFGILAMAAPGLGVPGAVDCFILRGYEFLCACFDRLPFRTWNPGRPRVWQIALFYVLLAGAVLLRRRGSARDGRETVCVAGADRAEIERADRGGIDRADRAEINGAGRAEIERADRVEIDRAGRAGMDRFDRAGADKASQDGESKADRNKAGRSKTDREDSANRRKGKKGERTEQMRWVLRYHAIVCVCGICLGVWMLGVRPPRENCVTFLDIGQGDCIIVRTVSGRTYLFDCGSSNRSSVGKYVLIPYLKYNGLCEIDAVFLSHPDADHVNGAVELFGMGGENNITVRQLLLPAIEKSERQEQLGELIRAAANASQESPVLVGYLSAGDSWSCDGAVFTCLHPAEGFRADDANAYSQCVLAQFLGEDPSGEGWSLLLTGDVEGAGESALLSELRARGIEGITVLKVAHHGSRNSTSAELLELLRPVLSVISSGRNNRYGHPHGELLERLEESGAHTVMTAQSGAVTVTFRGGTVRVSTMIRKK